MRDDAICSRVQHSISGCLCQGTQVEPLNDTASSVLRKSGLFLDPWSLSLHTAGKSLREKVKKVR